MITLEVYSCQQDARRSLCAILMTQTIWFVNAFNGQPNRLNSIDLHPIETLEHCPIFGYTRFGISHWYPPQQSIRPAIATVVADYRWTRPLQSSSETVP